MDWRVSVCGTTVYRSSPLWRLRPGGLILLFIAATAALPQPRVVSDTAAFYAAFVDVTVTHIRLANSIQVSAARGFGSWPLLLGRNCVVDGTPGSSYLRLDFNYVTNDWVQLGPGVTLTFRGLILVNIFSRSQLALDFFAPSSTSSSIVWEGVVDRRSICRPLQEIRNAWSKAGLGSQQQQEQQQQMEIVDGTSCFGVQGCYSTPVLRIVEAVVDSPAGYRLQLNDTLVVCEQFISAECIQTLGSDLCYMNAIEELMSKRTNVVESSSGPSGSSSESAHGGLSSGAQAGIIGGCVAGGAAVLLLVILLLRRSRLLRRRLDEEVGGSGAGGGIPGTFSVLGPPSSECALQAIGSSRSAAAAAANVVPQLQPQEGVQAQMPGGNAGVVQNGGSAAAAVAGSGDKQLLQDTNDVRSSPVMALVAALVSAGSSIRGSLRPSGSGARDMPYSNSGANMPASLPSHSHQSYSTLAPPPPAAAGAASKHRHGSSLIYSGGGGSTHSLGSALVSLLRSMVSRTGSHTHSHADRSAAVLVPAVPVTGLVASSGGNAAAVAGVPSGSSTAAAVADSSGSPRGVANVKLEAHAGMPRKSSSVEQKAAAAASSRTAKAFGRPSMGEIQAELDRMEEQWLGEGGAVSGKGRTQSASPPVQTRSPPRGGGSNGSNGGNGGRPSPRQPRGQRRDMRKGA